MLGKPQATVGSRDLVALWLLSLVTSAVVGIHGVAYWDAGDYVRLAIDGGQSGQAELFQALAIREVVVDDQESA